MSLNQAELKKHLKKFTQEALIKDVLNLFSQFDRVREYYEIKFCVEPDEDILDKYKAIIDKQLFPKKGFPKLKLSIAKKALTDYKKLEAGIPQQIELMLFYVEMGIECTMAYGDMYEGFYNSLESVFERACKMIEKNNLQKDFLERCRACCERVKDIGWGFYDGLSYTLYKYFNLEDSEV